MVSKFLNTPRMIKLTRHKDDDGDGVEVSQKIVGNAVKRHGGAHLSQVGVHLAVSQPEDGDPEEHTTSAETTGDLVNPGVVEVVPRGLVVTESGRPDRLPHLAVVPVLKVPRAHSLDEELECRSHNAAARGTQDVVLLADDQNRQGEQEKDRRNEVSQVEADVALGVNHTQLTRQGTDVDEQVEVVVDTSDGDGGVNDDTLAISLHDLELVSLQLFNDQRRDVWLEGTSSESHDEQTNNEASQRTLLVIENRRDGRDDENDVTDFSDDDRVEDSLVASEVGVGNPGSKKGAAVDPESVEGGQGESDLLAHSESTGLSILVAGVQSSTGGGRPLLGDEVGVDLDTSIVRHALDELNEGDGVDPPRNGGADSSKRGKLLLSW